MVTGKYDWTLGALYGQVLDLSWYDIHPQYHGKDYGFDYDFAILQLAQGAALSRRVLPACLPSPGTKYNQVAVMASGWGNGNANSKLNKIRLTTMPNSKCKEKWSRITENMICTLAPGRDTCGGDSGGPLVRRERGGYYTLVGVTSWGSNPCARPGQPGVFARVTSQLQWIKDNIEGVTCRKP